MRRRLPARAIDVLKATWRPSPPWQPSIHERPIRLSSLHREGGGPADLGSSKAMSSHAAVGTPYHQLGRRPLSARGGR